MSKTKGSLKLQTFLLFVCQEHIQRIQQIHFFEDALTFPTSETVTMAKNFKYSILCKYKAPCAGWHDVCHAFNKINSAKPRFRRINKSQRNFAKSISNSLTIYFGFITISGVLFILIIISIHIYFVVAIFFDLIWFRCGNISLKFNCTVIVLGIRHTHAKCNTITV